MLATREDRALTACFTKDLRLDTINFLDGGASFDLGFGVGHGFDHGAKGIKKDTGWLCNLQGRIRRIKCDESKPECLRCSKTGRRCDGYLPVRGQTPATGLAYAREVRETLVAPGPRDTKPRLMPSFKNDWTPTEQRAFYFYHRFSTTAVFTSINADFWTRIVPALCHHEPALRHAVFAIGELLETRYLRQRASNVYKIPTQFAAIQYGKAMSCLRAWKFPSHGRLAGTVASALPLLACALFVCIEFMVNDTHAAQIHIKQGRHLLAQFGSGHSPTAELVKRELVPIFTRLSLTFFFLGSRPDPVPAQLRWTPPPSDRPYTYQFETTTEGAQALYEIMDDICQLGQEITDWATSTEALTKGFSEKRARIEMQRDMMLNRLRHWNDSFRELNKLGLGHDHTGLIARLYYHMMTIFVGVLAEPLVHRECAYDRFISHFANCVVLAGHILNLETLAGESGARFCFESGLIPPLNYTVVKCRHPHIRRAALALLQILATSQHTENIWESNQVQHIAVRIMTLEEMGHWGPLDTNGVDNRDTLKQAQDSFPMHHDSGAADALCSQVPARILPIQPFCKACRSARGLLIRAPRPCVEHDRPSLQHLSTSEVLADVLNQSVIGCGDPGLLWLHGHPAQPEHFAAAEDRVHTIRIKLQGGKRSSLKVFVHLGVDDPLTWGVYQEEVSVDWVFACT